MGCVTLYGRLARPLRISSTAFLFLIFTEAPSIGMDIKSHFMPTQPQSVKLVRKLPAVAERHGRTVRFEPTIASNSIPNDVAVILKEKIRTLLLHAKEGEIQLVDGPADTVLRCTVTAYEPMIQRPNKRQIGLKDQQVLTLIGNMEASVQVLDSAGDPIDAGNLKQHLEKDYIVAEQEKKASALGGKDSKSNKAGGVIGMLRGGGDAGDIARVAGAGDPVHDALSSSVEKVERLPTESEWKSSLVEGLAIKVANRIVPVDEEFVVMLPGEKDFSQVCDMAKAGRWGDVQEKLETAGAMSGRSEAYRRYVLGLSSEAIAYSDAGTADKAVDLLNKASQQYKQASDMESKDREFSLAEIRAQDSLDHYLEIQHYLQKAKEQKATTVSKQVGSGTSNGQQSTSSGHGDKAADNAKLIQLTKAKMPDTVILTFVNSAPDPKFDVSADGLLELAASNVSPKVIEAAQQRMTAVPAKPHPAASPKRVPTAAAKPD